MVNGVGAASDCIHVDDYNIAAEDRVVMEAGESRKEACNGMMFTDPKAQLRLGCWNMRTMFALGKTA